jgi:hypothetical protein
MNPDHKIEHPPENLLGMPDKVEPPTHKTREQIRANERIRQEIDEVYKSMSEKFTKFFIEVGEPEGQEVTDKLKQMDAQWRVFCKRKNLVISLYPVMKNFMEDVVKEYIALKDKKETTEPEKP